MRASRPFLPMLAALGALSSAAGGATTMRKQFHVRDFGAVADTGEGVGPALRKAIAAALAARAPTEVVLDTGVYRIGRAPAGEYALSIADAEDLTLRGQGRATELVVTDPQVGAVQLAQCENVTVRGLTIDYDPAPFTQGTVTEVEQAANTFSLAVDEGYLTPDHAAFAEAKSAWGIVVRPGSESRQPVYGPLVVPATQYTPVGERRWKFAVEGPVHGAAEPLRMLRMKVGDRYVHLARNYAAAVAAWKCKRVTLEDVTVYASPGIALLPYLCGRVAIRNCRVKRRPGSDRLLSTDADGVHCRGCREGIVVEGCSFEGMADDAINIHSSPIPVTEVVSPTEVIVRKYHYTLQAGDRLEAMDTTACRVRGQAVATEVEEVEDKWAYRVRFDRPIEGIRAGVKFDDADNLYNLSECGEGSAVRNCNFRSFRGRGVLLSCVGCTVEDNTFDVNEGWGVALFHESTRWGEGPLARDITIRGNTFNGHGGYQSAIFAYPTRRDGKVSEAREMRNLVVRDNRFIDLGVPAVELHSCRDVLVEDNTVAVDASAHRPRPSYSSVIVDNCTGVTVRGLDVRDAHPRHQSAILISDSTASGDEGVSIADLSVELAAESVPVVDRRAH